MTDRVLWFGLLAAPLAWAAQLVTAWGIEESACERDAAGSVWGISPQSLTIAVSVAGAAVALAALLVAVRAVRQLSQAGEAAARRTFMACAGVLGSALFLGGIALAAAAALSLDSCRIG